ncbi:MAG: YbbR-like domain-containing protein [Prolixibacteraceae bacterium]|nr:YbbR-like domain-containing protein [Prolixibacteraceae bacterium]
MIKEYLNRNRRLLRNFNLKKNNRPLIFFVCFMIATALWLVNAMGKRYETVISMPIHYTKLPPNKVLVKAPPSSIEIKMEATGFTLLRHQIKLTINPLNFNVMAFTNNMMVKPGQSFFKVGSDQFLPQFSRQVSSEIKLIDISPDSLEFEFDLVVNELKPVSQLFELQFENQYFLYDSITFTPDSVMVNGPKSLVSSIDKVYAKPLKFKKLNTSLEKIVTLESIDQLDIFPRKVTVKIPVSQYTEYNEKIIVSKFNVPDSLNLVTLPGKIDVNCLVALTDFKSISPTSFIIGVDYNDLQADRQVLPLKIYSHPAHVKMLKISPVEVKYLIERKHD